jgi:hypothetical protein
MQDESKYLETYSINIKYFFWSIINNFFLRSKNKLYQNNGFSNTSCAGEYCTVGITQELSHH